MSAQPIATLESPTLFLEPAPPALSPGEPRHSARLASLAGVLTIPRGESAIVLVRGGNVVLEVVPDLVVTLEAGAVYASDGSMAATLRPERGDRAEVLCLWPDPASALVRPTSEARQLMGMVHDRDSAVAVAMEEMARTMTRERIRRHFGARPLQQWIDTILRAQRCYDAAIERCPGRTRARRRELFLRLARARALLAEPRSEADISQCARIARQSTAHFVRLFHAVFGDSPHQYRCRLRLERAHELITSTALPINQIMRRVGYGSLPIFARAFRQKYGTSATQLRQKTAARAAESGKPRPAGTAVLCQAWVGLRATNITAALETDEGTTRAGP